MLRGKTIHVVDRQPPRELRTERVAFSPFKFQRDQAIAIVTGAAERHELRIESIEEHRNLVSVDIQVTVTGAAHKIASFARDAGGTREREPSRTKFGRLAQTAMDGISQYLPW